jgi:hypothetical protein
MVGKQCGSTDFSPRWHFGVPANFPLLHVFTLSSVLRRIL